MKMTSKFNVGSFIKTFVYFKCYLTTPSSLFDWLEISIELKPRKNWVREGGVALVCSCSLWGLWRGQQVCGGHPDFLTLKFFLLEEP
jgi:hypothetical protein